MHRFTAPSTLLGLLLLCCVALPAHAQWKWKDASGKVQYSDLPPPNGTPEKDILQRPAGLKQPLRIVPYGQADDAASAPAPAANTQTKGELEQQARQKQQEQEREREQVAKQKEEERRFLQQKRENCTRAQENLRMLDSGVRISRSNDRGESIVLDERGRAEELQRTRNIVASECR
jgi:hypothetical protein